MASIAAMNALAKWLALILCCIATAPLMHAGPATGSSALNRQAPPDAVDPELIRRLAGAVSAQAGHTDRFDAEVWLYSAASRLQRFVRDEDERMSMLTSIHREAHRQSIDPDLVLAVIEVESRFDRFAVSRAGAQGVMQVMPFWKKELGRPDDNLISLDTNIRYGTAILAHYLGVARGDVVEALARYNGSNGLLKYPERVIRAWRKRWQSKPQYEIPVMQAGCNRYDLAACD